MNITGYGWAVIAFIFVSVWICWKIQRRYGRSLGCFGAVWVFLVVFTVGSLVAVFVPSAVQYVLYAPDRNVIMVVGMAFMLTVLITVYFGILKYAFGGNMASWVANVRTFGLLFFIPAVMGAFDLLLVYALLYGENVDILWVRALLCFFILVLTLAIPGYLKTVWEQYISGDFDPENDSETKEVQRRKKTKKSDRKRRKQ